MKPQNRARFGPQPDVEETREYVYHGVLNTRTGKLIGARHVVFNRVVWVNRMQGKNGVTVHELTLFDGTRRFVDSGWCFVVAHEEPKHANAA